MLLNSFVANDTAKNSLTQSVSGDRLPHAIMICGEKGSGVNHFAYLLARDILGEKSIQPLIDNKCASLRMIYGTTKTGQISIESVRNLIDELNYSSIQGHRVILFKDADNLNVASANALLKSIEEPNEGITYILTTKKPSRILPTIRSRCSIYTLSFPNIRQTKEYFRLSGAEEKSVDWLISIYDTNIGKIKKALDSPERLSILKQAISLYNAIIKHDRYNVSRQVAPFSKAKSDLVLLADDLELLASKQMSPRNVHILQVIQQYRNIFTTNINANLLCECFASDISK